MERRWPVRVMPSCRIARLPDCPLFLGMTMRIRAEGITDRVVGKQPLIDARYRGIMTGREWAGRTASAAPEMRETLMEEKPMRM